ncbi:MAG: copper amine oxidase N-terminal domain-containing protein [Caldisericia bacterium]|nr:copper amine oxidase N-terminal domain-containing protein [Caldisericia bacterium]
MYKNSISDKYLFISTYTCNPWEHKLTVVDVKNGNIAEEIRNLPQFFGYFYHNNKLYVQRGYGKSSIYNINDFKELGSVEGYIGYYSIYDGYPYLKKPVPDTERYFSKTITRVDPEKYKNDRHYEFDHGVNEFHVQKIDDAHFFITQAPDNRVICYSDKFSPSSPENDPDPEPVKSILKFTIDTKEYKLNGVKNSIDVAPIIKNGSTLLPARYVTEPLGGDVSWGEWEEKVICELGQNIVGLWIDLSIAEVNGVEVQIDPNNSKITPIIINDRTMVPMRFLAESLGCEVEWIAESKEIILTYSP